MKQGHDIRFGARNVAPDSGARLVVDWAWCVGLGTLAFIIFGQFFALDPDLHHDGFQLSIAAGLMDGKSIYGEVFSFYGPLTHWVQSWWLEAFGFSVLQLRLLTLLAYAIASASMYWIVRLFHGPRSLAITSVVMWIFLCPTIGGPEALYPLWAMPSSVQLALLLPATALLLLAVQQRGSFAWAFGSGVLFGLSVMMRFNYALPVVVLTAGALFFFRPPGDRFSLRTLGGLIAGVGAGLTAAVGALIAQGAFSPFLGQTVFGATRFGGLEVAQWDVFLPLLAVVGLPYLLLVMATLKVAKSSRWTFLHYVGLLGLFFATLILAGVSTGTRVRALIVDGLLTAEPGSVPESLASGAALAPLYAAWIAMFAGAGWIVLLWTQRHGYRTFCVEVSDSEMLRVIVIAAGLGLAVQAFPLFDTYHLWWASALTIPAAASLVHWPQAGISVTVSILILVVPFLAVCAYQGFSKLSAPRVEIQTGVLAGMKVREETYEQFQDLDRVLSSLPRGETRFLCPDGMLAAWTGVYVPDSAAHVNWAYAGVTPPDNGTVPSSYDPMILDLPKLQTPVKARAVVLCTNSPEQEDVFEWAQGNQLVVEQSTNWIKPGLNAGYYVYRLSPAKQGE